MDNFLQFFQDIYKKRSVLYELAKRNFQKQYMGSYLGFVWIYLEPLLFVSVIYIIFSTGLKGGSTVDGAPFIVYLITGIVPWFYIAGNLNSNTKVIQQYSFLLKKVDFRLSMLPIVNIMSSFIPHIFLIVICLVIMFINDLSSSLYIFQLVYYFIAMVSLLLGIAWLTSSVQLFIPDIAKFVGLIITFGFWLTPVFWSINKIPLKYHWLISLNPFAYIVQGYRDSLYLHIGFWEKPYDGLAFWVITAFFLVVGIVVFKRLRPHFAEVA